MKIVLVRNFPNVNDDTKKLSTKKNENLFESNGNYFKIPQISVVIFKPFMNTEKIF